MLDDALPLADPPLPPPLCANASEPERESAIAKPVAMSFIRCPFHLKETTIPAMSNRS
jgi:hypothetical protein